MKSKKFAQFVKNKTRYELCIGLGDKTILIIFMIKTFTITMIHI